MDNNFFNQNIDCDVKSCKNCDYSIGKCLLASIKIVKNNNNKNNINYDEAFCANYQKK